MSNVVSASSGVNALCLLASPLSFVQHFACRTHENKCTLCDTHPVHLLWDTRSSVAHVAHVLPPPLADIYEFLECPGWIANSLHVLVPQLSIVNPGAVLLSIPIHWPRVSRFLYSSGRRCCSTHSVLTSVRLCMFSVLGTCSVRVQGTMLWSDVLLKNTLTVIAVSCVVCSVLNTSQTAAILDGQFPFLSSSSSSSVSHDGKSVGMSMMMVAMMNGEVMWATNAHAGAVCRNLIWPNKVSVVESTHPRGHGVPSR